MWGRCGTRTTRRRRTDGDGMWMMHAELIRILARILYTVLGCRAEKLEVLGDESDETFTPAAPSKSAPPYTIPPRLPPPAHAHAPPAAHRTFQGRAAPPR